MKGSRITTIAVVALLVLILFLGKLSWLWTEYGWFGTLDYQSVFTTILTTRILLFLVFGAVFFLILWPNIRVGRGKGSLVEFLPPSEEWAPFNPAKVDMYVNRGIIGLVVVIALLAAFFLAGAMLFAGMRWFAEDS